ncbi:MAG: hypothetical protein U0802_02325 [Candidatus Binatia bacterium]
MALTSKQWLIASTALAVSSAAPAAAFQHQEYRADDGTAYQVLRSVAPIGGGADHERITTLAGAPGGTGGCNLSTMDAAAVVGVISPGQVLHPFASIRRTAILLPNDANALNFDPSGAGKVTIGTGGGAVKVCRVGGDCGGSGQALVGLDTADANVPKACIASGVQADCEANTRSTIGFGLAATGNPPQCTTNPTVNTDICANEPGDGFSLAPGQAIVFVYNGSLGGIGFGVGAGAFGIDADESGSVCADGGVVSATAPSQSLPGPGRPRTHTPAPMASTVGLGLLAALCGLLGVSRLRRAA